MNTNADKRSVRRRLPRLVAVWLFVLACSSDAHVGCSPTLTCSLRPSRFAPPHRLDAGISDCDRSQSRCPVAQLSAGGRHACVVTNAKNVLCWGDNEDGQRGPDEALDVGTDMETDAAVYVDGFSRVLDDALQVSAGDAHTCALLQDQTVWCWGSNSQGQVDGTTRLMKVLQPVRVAVDHVTQIAAGALHTCALTDEGVICWGMSPAGQAGREPSDPDTTPRLVSGTQAAAEVACGVRHCCARNRDGVACWGELIDDAGEAYVSAQPIPIDGTQGALQVSAGAGHSCALKADSVVCWGKNDNGQLGDGTTRASAVAIDVVKISPGAGYVAAGGGEIEGRLVGHTCAVDSASQVICWGRNAEGQLGQSVSADRALPEVVEAFHADGADALDQISRLSLGALFSCALGSRGSVYCWGDNSSAQLGENLDPQGSRKPSAGQAVRVQRFGRQR